MNTQKNNFAGKDGFIWWTGAVEDRQDPLKLGRCRVRCLGWHSPNKMELPTNFLPWAIPSVPINMPNVYTPREGDMVFGFFLDGENAQQPVMLGSFPNIPIKAPNAQQPFNDPRTNSELSVAPVKPYESATNYPRKLDEPTTSRLARNDANYPSEIVTAKKNKRANKVEPASYYAAKYPYNNVYESESGHALEFDDTKDAERVHIYHRSGSYVEWAPDGSRSERIQKDKFEVVVGNEAIYIKGDVQVYVDGDYNLNVTGDIKINGKTVNINRGTKGAARIGDTTRDNDSEINGPDTGEIKTGSGTVFIGN
jgi:Gp5 N-terminal OB domain